MEGHHTPEDEIPRNVTRPNQKRKTEENENTLGFEPRVKERKLSLPPEVTTKSPKEASPPPAFENEDLITIQENQKCFAFTNFKQSVSCLTLFSSLVIWAVLHILVILQTSLLMT